VLSFNILKTKRAYIVCVRAARMLSLHSRMHYRVEPNQSKIISNTCKIKYVINNYISNIKQIIALWRPSWFNVWSY
jgi:hypothetical protein